MMNAVNQLEANGVDVALNIVGVGLNADDQAQLQAVAQAGNGRYIPSKDISTLSVALQQALSVQFIVTDAQGNVVYRGLVNDPTISLPVGDYTVRVMSNPQLTFTVSIHCEKPTKIGIGEGVEPPTTTPEPPAPNATDPSTVQGQVVDATNDEPIAGAEVCLRGTEQCTTTDSDGNHTFPDVPPGEHLLDVNAPGFSLIQAQPLSVTPGETVTQNFALSPELAEGELRIVLSWGEHPKDLDSHLWLPPSQPYHIYWSDEIASPPAPNWMWMRHTALAQRRSPSCSG